ncbi:MAG: hypothetical protein WBN42_00070, partial [Ignavibacteriaceae bacterium]
IPNEIKKQYDKQEIERILFSPEKEPKTKPDKKEEPETEPEDVITEVSAPEVDSKIEELEDKSETGFEKPSSESFLTPEEEEALLSLYNEEPKVTEEVSLKEDIPSEEKTLEPEEIEFENVESEDVEEKTISPILEESAEPDTESKDDLENIVDAISDDFDFSKVKTEEQSIENFSESIETDIDDQGDNLQPDLLRPGLEKEIVQEMIKDFYGESESTISEKEELKTEEIPESEPEEVKAKIETLEDELLNIFEGLDKEEKPIEEETETLFQGGEIIEEKQSLTPTDADGLDDYLKSIGEVVFSDKKEKTDEDEKRVEVNKTPEEPEKKDEIPEKETSSTLKEDVKKSEKIVEETKKEIPTILKEKLPASSIEEPAVIPRTIRSKDLFSYLRRKEIKKIVLLIFANDEEDFMNTTERIMDCHSYKEASEILKAVFTSYKISPYSKEAITFTNAVSNYFRQA